MIARSFARNRATAVFRASGDPEFLKLRTALFWMTCFTASFSGTRGNDLRVSSLCLSLSTVRCFATSGDWIRSASDDGWPPRARWRLSGLSR